MFKKKLKKILVTSMAFSMILSNNVFATPIDSTNSTENVYYDDLNRTEGTDYFEDETTNNWNNGQITEEVRVNVGIESQFTITIPKDIVLDGESGIANYIVNAKGDIAGDQTLSVIPDENFSMKEAGGKNDVTATVMQEKTEYSYQDLMNDGTDYSGSVTAELSAGKWEGSFFFNINFNANDKIIYKLTYTTINNETFTIEATSVNELKKYTTNNPELKSATLNLTDTNVRKQDFSNLFSNNINLESVDLTKTDLRVTSNTQTMFTNSTKLTNVKVDYSTVKNKNSITDDLGITSDILTTINKTFNDYTWEEISEISENGKASTTFALGDVKKVEINGTTYGFRIIGFNHDNLSDGSGKAGITLQATTGYTNDDKENYMNPTSSNAGGWKNTYLRNYLNNNFYNDLPQDLQDAIKTVNKLTGSGSGSSVLQTTEDKVFIISEVEGGRVSTWAAAGEGTQYAYLSRSRLNTFYDKAWYRSPCIYSGSSQPDMYRTHFLEFSKESDYGTAATWANSVGSMRTIPCFCI